MALTARNVEVISSGATGIKYYITGWFFTETGGVSSVTVKIRKTNIAGGIIWQATLPAGSSVGEELTNQLSLRSMSATDAYVEVTGTGTLEGGVRGN